MKVKEITEWLLSEDLLKISIVNGKKYKLPTQKGKALGLSTEARINKYDEWYTTVLYNRTAQNYIIDNFVYPAPKTTSARGLNRTIAARRTACAPLI